MPIATLPITYSDGNVLAAADLTNNFTTLNNATVPVASGGTGLTAGTSGGVLYYSAAGTLASSGALTANGVVYGGGAGVAPAATAQGGTRTILTANAGAPAWSAAPIINNSVQVGVASSTTGEVRLAHASSANLTTIQPSNAGAARTITLPDASVTLVGLNSEGGIAPTGNPAGTPAANAIYLTNSVKGCALVAANGTLTGGFNASSSRTGVGAYTITWDRDFAGTTYFPVVMPSDGSIRLVTTLTLAAGTLTYTIVDNAGVAQDTIHIVIAVGLQ